MRSLLTDADPVVEVHHQCDELMRHIASSMAGHDQEDVFAPPCQDSDAMEELDFRVGGSVLSPGTTQGIAHYRLRAPVRHAGAALPAASFTKHQALVAFLCRCTASNDG